MVNGGMAIIFMLIAISPFFMELTSITLPFGVHVDCFYLKHTGRVCPSCGLTRSLVALYNGDIALSRTYHPRGYLFAVLLFFEILMRVIPIMFKSKWVLWLDVGQLIIICLIMQKLFFLA